MGVWKLVEILLLPMCLGGTSNKQAEPLLRINPTEKGGFYFLSTASPDLHNCEKSYHNDLNLDSNFILPIKYFLYNFNIH